MNSINKISLTRYRIKLTYSPQHTVRHGFPCVQLYKILYHCKANLCQIETLQCKFRVSYSKLSTLSTGCIKHKIKIVLRKKKKNNCQFQKEKYCWPQNKICLWKNFKVIIYKVREFYFKVIICKIRESKKIILILHILNQLFQESS